MSRGTSEVWSAKDIPDQSGRIVIVTGGNRGLGMVVARELAKAGADVVLGAHDCSRTTTAVREIEDSLAPGARLTPLPLDLADLSSIRAFVSSFTENWRGVDLIVNNAAVAAIPERSVTVDGFESQFGTNHLGHFALTGLLLGAQRDRQCARVVSATAQMNRIGRINFDDLQSERRYSRWLAYAQSKLATLIFAIELDRRLRGAGLPSRSLAAHPGAARTHEHAQAGAPLVDRLFNTFTNRFAAKSPDEGARAYLYAATASGLAGGSYIGPAPRGAARPAALAPPAKALDSEVAPRLWSVSEELTGVSYELAPAAAVRS